MPAKKTKRNKRSVLPPLDVRSSSALKDMEKRIREGPVTLVLVYADWCGHCHQLMPHWDKAASSAHRSVQAVKVNEKMLPKVNSMMNRSINQQAPPINVSGYPTIIMVDNKANQVTQVEPVKDAAVLSKAMNQVGPLADQAQAQEAQEAQPAQTAQTAQTAQPAQTQEVVEEPITPSLPSEADMVLPNRSNSMNRMAMNTSSPMANVQPESLSLYAETAPTKVDPLRKTGGSLYSSLSQSAYTLAPAAVLMGMASAMMTKRKGTRKGGARKSRRGVRSKKGSKAKTAKRRH